MPITRVLYRSRRVIRVYGAYCRSDAREAEPCDHAKPASPFKEEQPAVQQTFACDPRVLTGRHFELQRDLPLQLTNAFTNRTPSLKDEHDKYDTKPTPNVAF
jgi:hypothetical protein